MDTWYGLQLSPLLYLIHLSWIPQSFPDYVSYPLNFL
jgi:hypothetical protein